VWSLRGRFDGRWWDELSSHLLIHVFWLAGRCTFTAILALAVASPTTSVNGSHFGSWHNLLQSCLLSYTQACYCASRFPNASWGKHVCLYAALCTVGCRF